MPPSRHRSPYARNEERWGYLMIAPLVLGIVIFYYLPMIESLLVSFTEWDVISAPKWIGVANYKFLFQDEIFRKTIWNTVRFVILYVPITLTIALSLALVLNTKIRLRGLYRLIFFLPVLTMPIAVSYVWRWVYHPTYGVLSLIIQGMGGPKLNFLGNINLAMYSVVVVAVWMGVGFQMIIFLAGLQNIPRTYYEAALVDGANGWQRFWWITLPLLTPTVFFNLVISLISAFQVFDLIYALTKGGPLESTRTVVYTLWEDAFHYFRMGRATAEGWILFAIILVFTVIQMRIQRQWVHYD